MFLSLFYIYIEKVLRTLFSIDICTFRNNLNLVILRPRLIRGQWNQY